MGDKGGKKNREKMQKQSSDKHRQKAHDKLERQQRGDNLQELPAEKTAKKNALTAAVKANMKAVEKAST